MGDELKKNLDLKSSVGGSKIYGVWINIGKNADYGDEFRSQVRRVSANKTATNLGIFCFPTPETANWATQLSNLIDDVGQQVPVTLLNYLPRDDTIQNIRRNDEARHKSLVSFKSKVAKAAFENSFALVEAFLPVSNWAHGLDTSAKNKFLAIKFEKIAGLAISAFKAGATAGDGNQPTGSSLINPALLPDSPAKMASNGCPTENTVYVKNQPDKQLTEYLAGLTSVVDSNAKLMQSMATQNLALQANQVLPPPMPEVAKNMLRVGNKFLVR